MALKVLPVLRAPRVLQEPHQLLLDRLAQQVILARLVLLDLREQVVLRVLMVLLDLPAPRERKAILDQLDHKAHKVFRVFKALKAILARLVPPDLKVIWALLGLLVPREQIQLLLAPLAQQVLPVLLALKVLQAQLALPEHLVLLVPPGPRELPVLLVELVPLDLRELVLQVQQAHLVLLVQLAPLDLRDKQVQPVLLQNLPPQQDKQPLL